MSEAYFDAGNGGDWESLANWYGSWTSNNGFSNPLGEVGNDRDTVILCNGYPTSPAVCHCKSLLVRDTGSHTYSSDFVCSVSATFSPRYGTYDLPDWGVTGDAVITAPIVAFRGCTNYGIVIADVIYMGGNYTDEGYSIQGNSGNQGTMTADRIYMGYDNYEDCGNHGILVGTVYMLTYAYSRSGSAIDGNAFFNTDSYCCGGTIDGNCVMNGGGFMDDWTTGTMQLSCDMLTSLQSSSLDSINGYVTTLGMSEAWGNSVYDPSTLINVTGSLFYELGGTNQNLTFLTTSGGSTAVTTSKGIRQMSSGVPVTGDWSVSQDFTAYCDHHEMVLIPTGFNAFNNPLRIPLDLVTITAANILGSAQL
jgi:hypothetical protein